MTCMVWRSASSKGSTVSVRPTKMLIHDGVSDQCRGLVAAQQGLKEGAGGDEPAGGDLPVDR
jgi:hypothetical protein